MLILITFVIVLLVIGVVVVLRSGEREIAMDKKDQELQTPSEQFQMLPHITLDTKKESQESWTLESGVDTADQETKNENE